MVDAFKICFFSPELLEKKFTGPIFTSAYKEEVIPTKIYCLYSNGDDSAYLSITIKANGKITITGSLRKWYFGKRSLLDFSPKTYLLAIKKIAEKLELPYERLLTARIYNFEFGKNFILKEKTSEVLPTLLRHPKLTKDTFGNSEETIRFRGENFFLEFYDKVKEMRKKEMINKVLATRINVLRYEIKIKKTSALYDKIGDIKSVYDIVKGWNKLVCVWREEFNKVIFYSEKTPIITDFEKWGVKDYKNFLISNGLYERGIENVYRDINKLGTPASRKSELRKELKEISEGYSIAGNYNNNELFKKVQYFCTKTLNT